jgi:hypothetical protein
MRVLGRTTEGNAAFPYAGYFDVVVEWDWSKLPGLIESPVVAMWPLAQPPVANPTDPDRNGYTLMAGSIELGVRFEGSSDAVLRLGGVRLYHGADGRRTSGIGWPAIVWEFDLTDGVIS